MSIQNIMFRNFAPSVELRSSSERLMQHLKRLAPRDSTVVSIVERAGSGFRCTLEVVSNICSYKVLCKSEDPMGAVVEARKMMLRGLYSHNGASLFMA